MLRRIVTQNKLIPMTSQPLLDVAGFFSSVFDDGRDGRAEWHALLQREFGSGRADPECSSLITNAGQIVAGCLVNRHGVLGRIGPTGVREKWRRLSLGRTLVRHCLTLLFEQGVTGAALEVDENNHGAIAMYKQVGFLPQRLLYVLKGADIDSLPLAEDLAIVPLNALEALGRMANYQSHEPVYQRRPGYTRTLGSRMKAAGALRSGQVVGLIVWLGRDIVDLVAENGDVGIIERLVHEALRDSPSFRIINMAEDELVLPALEAIGFTVTTTALEMRMHLE